MFPVLAGLAVALCLCCSPQPGRAAQNGVVLSYARIGDDTVAAMNTPLDRLDAHLAEIKAGGFKPLPLDMLVQTLLNGGDVPDRAVAVAVDGGGRAFFADAWPRFKAAQIPLTLFVSVDDLDRASPSGPTWDQVRLLAHDPLISFGLLGAGAGRPTGQTAAAFAADLIKAKDRFESATSLVPAYFAWPYGEMARDLAEEVRKAGFKAAFGQHSGAIWPQALPHFLPRFSLNGVYGEPDRFRVAIRSQALPVQDITPDDPKVRGTNPPAFGFTLDEAMPGLDHLACQTAHEGRVKVERLGPRIEIRMTKPLPKGRTRLNCTTPSLDGRWRWFGWQFSTD